MEGESRNGRKEKENVKTHAETEKGSLKARSGWRVKVEKKEGGDWQGERRIHEGKAQNLSCERSSL